jgi:predicted amidohydrolase YtcJ
VILWLVTSLVIQHANVLTGDAHSPRARCIEIDGERIRKIGLTDDDCKSATPPGTTIDAHGATVTPGFNDAHVHLGLTLTLASAPHVPSTSADAWRDLVRAAAARRPHGAWAVVQAEQFPDGISHASDLDFIDHPVLVVTRHGALFNSQGVRAAQLGRFIRSGFVPGRLVAAALDRVAMLQPIDDQRSAAHQFLTLAASLGITSAQIISDEMPGLFEDLREQGKLTLRLRFVPLGFRFENFLYRPTWLASAPLWVRVDGVKYFHDDPAQLSRGELAQIVSTSVARNQRVVMHVLGRYSLRKYLDAVETGTSKNPAAARLFRIDHADELNAEDARRIARLGMVVCANPTLIAEWKSSRLGPLKTLLDAGVHLCLGTDWIGPGFARPLAPLVNLKLAATHGGFGTEERITAAQALAAYTLGSAYGEGLEQEKGTLAPGKLADLVLLAADPTAVPPEQIAQIPIVATIVGGRVVYRAPQQPRPVGR